MQHRLIDCDVYMGWTVPQRRYFVRTLTQCYQCLGTNHTSRNCPKRKNLRCELCTENNHHWSLCFKHNNQNRNKTNPSSPTENNQLNVDCAGTPDSEHNTTRRPNSLYIQYTLIFYKSRTRGDYAPMVITEIKTGDGRWVKANCFLDTGSNSSLVHMKFAKQTKLYSCGTSDVQFNVAGGGCSSRIGRTI